MPRPSCANWVRNCKNAASEASCKKKRRRILFIDDDPTQFRLVQELFGYFHGERFDLDWASWYEDGLKRLLSGDYCACLLDYQLGETNGLQLLHEATAAQCPTPVIVLTGWATEDVDIAALNAGASDYLVKSEITPHLLERALRYTLKLSETMEALRSLATRDDVTGLLNRREMDRLLLEEWQRAGRFHRPFSLVLVDLDHFKSFNDTYGHQVGDAVLRHAASLLAGQVRAVDRVARYGGEEFAIIQVEATRDEAMESARRFCALLADMPCVLPDRGLVLNVTLSAGVAAYPDDAATVEELLSVTDRALYTGESARPQLCRRRARARRRPCDQLSARCRCLGHSFHSPWVRYAQACFDGRSGGGRERERVDERPLVTAGRSDEEPCGKIGLGPDTRLRPYSLNGTLP
jgi:two-component system cell cycle response regulator